MFIEEVVLPIPAAQVEPLERSFKQEPVNLRLPIRYEAPQREIIVIQQPNNTLALLGFLGFLAFILGIIALKR